MKLSLSTIDTLAEMICGADGYGENKWEGFPYRSSSYLTAFFRKCNLPYKHDGTTRKYWVIEVLEEINNGSDPDPSLPSIGMIAVIKQLVNPLEFRDEETNHELALKQVNELLVQDGLQVRFIEKAATIENLQTQASTKTSIAGRVMTQDELIRRKRFEEFLNEADEDEFTDKLLVRLFRQLNFQRVTPSGHRDKLLEFGRDVWMKYGMPTGHQLYVGVQVKIGRIHSSGADLDKNIAGILAQLFMLATYPITDPDTNTKHLLDHIYLVSSGEITKQARHLLFEHLSIGMRRNVFFMDREEILDLCVKHNLPLPYPEEAQSSEDEIPF